MSEECLTLEHLREALRLMLLPRENDPIPIHPKDEENFKKMGMIEGRDYVVTHYLEVESR